MRDQSRNSFRRDISYNNDLNEGLRTSRRDPAQDRDQRETRQLVGRCR